jgi:Leucine Rich repeat
VHQLPRSGVALGCPCLTKLKLVHANLTGSGIQFSALSVLQSLHLLHCRLDHADADAIASGMSGLKRLTCLRVVAGFFCGWGGAFLRDLCMALPELRTLRVLDLRTFWALESNGPLAAALSHVSGLQVLHLLDNVEYSGARPVVGSISAMTGLSSLRIRDTGENAAVGAALAQGLARLSSVVELEFSYSAPVGDNNIDTSGVLALCLGIARQALLMELDLGGQQIDSEAIATLGPAIAQLTRLKTLNLKFNQLGDKGVRALLPHLAPLTELQVLHLSNNCMSRACKQDLRTRLTRCKWMAGGATPFGRVRMQTSRLQPRCSVHFGEQS